MLQSKTAWVMNVFQNHICCFFIWMHAYCLSRRDCHCSRARHIFMLTHICGIGDWFLWLYLATLLKVVFVTHGPMHRVLWLASACERCPHFLENNMKPESFPNQLMFCACVFIFQTSAYSTSLISVFSTIFTLLLYTSTQSNHAQC